MLSLTQVVFVMLMFHVSSPRPAQISPQQPTQTRPIAVAALKPGETCSIQLCWDQGLGRAPAVFLGSTSVIYEERGIEGKHRLEQPGLMAKYDEQLSSELQRAFYKDGKYAGVSKGQPGKHLTVVSVQLTATPDAKPGTRAVMVHIVSGSGRDMKLSGEIRVLIIGS